MRPPRAFSHSLPEPMHSPHSTDARPQAARCTPADLTTHSPSKTFARPRTTTRPSCTLPLPLAAQTHTRKLRDARPPTTQHSPPKIFARPRTATRPPRALSHSLPEHFRSSTQRRRTPAGCAMNAHRPHNTFPTEGRRPSPQRRPASPSVPLRTQKNGTAQWMCDAECLGRPSLRSVIGVGEPRAVRRRCGALAWRVGLRPQPWALRSRRCGRVLRA